MSFPADFPNPTIGYDWGQVAYNGGQHPSFAYNGNLYTFVTEDSPVYATTPSQDYLLHCLTSTDGGTTWVELDSATAPGPFGSPATGALKSPQYCVARDGSTALIFLSNMHSTGGGNFGVLTNILIKFDLTGGTWSTTSSFGSPVTAVVNTGFGGISATFQSLTVVAPGQYLLFHSSTPASNHARLAVTTFDGVTLGTPAVLPGQSGTNNYLGCTATLDSAGRLHCFYIVNGDPNYPLQHVAYDSGTATFGTQATILNAFVYWTGTNGPSVVSNAIVYTPTGGGETIAIAAEVNDPTFSFQSIAYYTALAALNPTWSESDITTGTDNGTGLSGSNVDITFPIPYCLSGGCTPVLQIVERAGTITAVWNNNADTTYAGSVITSSSPSDVLAWTAAAVLFATGPITGASFTSDGPAQIDVFPITSTTFGILVSLIDIRGNGAEGMQFNPATAGPTPPAGPFGGCGGSSSGTVNETYTHTFPATGGTPPYTFAITSGALPAGITLDAATGVASGRPTATGTSSFEITVTDALGATAVTVCSGTIAPVTSCE